MLSNAAGSPEACAAELLETVPALMRFIRAQMRSHRGPDLSVPQFRTLVFLDRRRNASLSALAEYLGLSLPAASRLVEGLIRRNLVTRRIPPENRRRVALSLRAWGEKTVRAAQQATERQLAEVLAASPGRELAAIERALRRLREEFQSAAEQANP
jgi:DNA-binding MarR family transcriptional regulator